MSSMLVNFTSNTEEAIVFKWFSVMFMCFVNICIIGGNGILLAAILTSRCLRRPTYYFIASLTISDLSVGILVLPFFTDALRKGVWTYGQDACHLWMALHACLSTASIYNLIAIAMDRFLAVTRPLTYRALLTPFKVKIAICVVWSFAFSFTIPFLFPIWFPTVNSTKSIEIGQCTLKNYGRQYGIFSMFSSFYVPILILICTYALIYRTTRRVRLNQQLGQLDVISTTSAASLASQSAVNTTGSGSAGMATTTFDSKRNENAYADNEIAPMMRPRLQSPILLRIHKGRYRRYCSVESPQRNSNGSPMKARLPHLIRNLQPLATGGLGVFLAPKRSVSEILGDHSPMWYRSRENSKESSQFSTLSDPEYSRNRPWTKMEHDFWFRMAMRKKRLSVQLFNVWSPKKMAIQRYQQKMSFEIRALKTFVLVTMCFLTCWLGYCAMTTYDLISPLCQWMADGVDQCTPRWVSNVVTGFAYVNSALNPLIYGVSNRNFRLAFKRMINSQLRR